MGDAFIHFVFARGIADGQFFFYNGQFSAGSTSPFWSLLLAPVWKIFGMQIIWAVKILASFFVALAIVLAFKFAEKISSNRIAALATAALLATNFVLPFWAAKGMETPLFVCLVLGSFLVYLELVNPPAKSTSSSLTPQISGELTLGLILGVAILTRPEAWFLTAFLGIGLLAQKKWRALLTVGLPTALIFAPYYFWLFANTGSIFPSTIARILRARQWAHEFGGIFFTLEIPKILVTKFLPLTPFFLLFFFYKPVNPPPRWWVNSSISYPIFAWLAFHAIFFSVIFPTTEGYRYILAALPFFYLISILGVFRLPKKWQTPILVLVLLGSLLISGQQFLERRASIASCEQPFLDQARRDVGLWLEENTPTDSLIALKEVDQSAFFGERRMLSLDGTLDARAIPFVQSGDQLQFLKNERPNFFVLEEEMYREYPAWKKSNVLSLADANLKIGDTKILDGVSFTLRAKLKSGDPKSCSNFSSDYFWWIFAVKFTP